VRAAIIALVLAGAAVVRGDSTTIRDYADGIDRPYAPMGGTQVGTTRCSGPDTTLVIEETRARMPQHDVDLGRTRFELHDAQNKILASQRVAELWDCLEYLPSTRRYVLTSTNEHGTRVSLRALVYLDARDGRFHDSAFEQTDFEAMSSKLGPDGRWLALVGARTKNQNEKTALFALDLEHDRLIRLGPAPAPPPMSQDALSFSKDAVDMSWAWGAPERSYEELAPDILRFVDAHALEVSYGADTAHRRVKQRRVKRYPLD
jgi:hypothetical protein